MAALLKPLVEKALEESKNEREIHSFLKNQLQLVRTAFGAFAWNHNSTIPEYKLGNEFRVDFLILTADSGQWHATFVELKSHLEQPFTKKGVPGAGLNVAIAQMQDRKLWVEANNREFRRGLSKVLEDKGTPAQCLSSDLHTKAATEIIDHRTHISFNYIIVAGRRNMIPDEHQRRRHVSPQVEIATYDRLLGVAERFDKAEMERKG